MWNLAIPLRRQLPVNSMAHDIFRDFCFLLGAVPAPVAALACHHAKSIMTAADFAPPRSARQFCKTARITKEQLR